MKEWAKVLGLAAIVVLLATGLALACGGGEGEDGTERAPAAEEEETEPARTEDTAPEREEGASEEEVRAYVRSFCEAFGRHSEGF